MRYLLLLLTFATAAQATTVCGPSTTFNPDTPEWPGVKGYAEHKRFDTTAIQPRQQCTRDDGTVYYIASVPAKIIGRDPGQFLYDPSAPRGLQVVFSYHTNPRRLNLVAQAVVRRIILNRDGTILRFQLLTFSGRRLALPTLPLTIRRALQPAAEVIQGNGGCVLYYANWWSCMNDQAAHAPSALDIAQEAYDLAKNLMTCSDSGTGCGDLVTNVVKQIVESCDFKVGDSFCYTANCHLGHCEEAYPGIPVCQADHPDDPADVNCTFCTCTSCGCPLPSCPQCSGVCYGGLGTPDPPCVGCDTCCNAWVNCPALNDGTNAWVCVTPDAESYCQ